MANVEKDFEELLRLFNKHKVHYCIVGAFAVGFHARPRYTKDLDLLVEASEENGKKIVSALGEFGFGNLEIRPEDFTEEGRFIQLGYEPVRVDLTTSIEGVHFKEIWGNKASGTLGSEPVYFIGLKELVKNKKAARRKQDLADLELLEKAKKQ
ncbi:MAG: hypothetical protein HYY44_08270 [Deltaproteobacteria bacterium]|nr:hypothetical protein [Deltaproteobacteria bacterium]MBI4373632.1 hypothetical protein [Deltaproteobacteria bacterium]